MRRFVLAGCATLGAALVLRAPFLARYGGVANLDEANIGVMGMDILRGKFPIFMYGHTYFGPLEAIFEALALLVFPPHPFILRLAILAIAVLAMFVVWRGARVLLDEGGAFMAAAWFALPPVILTIWTILPNGAHIAGLLTGSLIFYLAAKIIVTEKPSPALFFVFGLVIGFSLWNHPGNLLHVVAAVIVILLAKISVLRGWGVPVSLAGCAIGGAPFWIAIVKNLRTVDFGQSGGVGRPLSVIARDMWGSVELAPLFLGYGLLPDYAAWPLTAAFVLILAAGIMYTAQGLLKRSHGALASLFGLLLALMSIAAYSLIDGNKMGWVQWRYFLPILLGLSYVFGYTFQRVSESSKRLGGVMFAVLIGANVIITFHSFYSGSYNAYKMDTRLEDRFFTYKELLPVFEKLNIDTAFVRFYDDTPIVYESGGKVKAAAYTDSRLKEYSTLVQASESPAFAMEKHLSGYFEAGLKAKLAGYDKEEGSAYDVYYNISPPGGVYVPIDRGGITATASPHPEAAPYALDGVMNTFWNSMKPQTGDEMIELDLGGEVELARIDLVPSWYTDAPSEVVIELSMDGREWTKAGGAPNIGSLFWTGPHLSYRVWEGFNQYLFPPTPARRVRIRQTGTAGRHWHVREMFLYRMAPAPRHEDTVDWDRLLSFLREHNIGSIVSDFYFSANVIIRSEGRVWANVRLNNLNPDERARWVFDLDGIGALAAHQRDAAQIEAFFDSQGVERKTKTFGPYRLLYGLKSPHVGKRKLSRDECRIEKSDRLVCDFGRQTLLRGFTLPQEHELAGKRLSGAMAYSTDGAVWKNGPVPRRLFNRVHWTGNHVIGMDPSHTYFIPPIEARYVTFTLR